MPPRKRKATEDATSCGDPYPSGTSYGTPGSSTNPLVLDSSPKPKRQRKAKDPDAPAPEKRGAIFKKMCPKNIIERVQRVMGQRCDHHCTDSLVFFALLTRVFWGLGST